MEGRGKLTQEYDKFVKTFIKTKLPNTKLTDLL